jgi:hypothetical protein
MRKNISVHQQIDERANKIIERRGFSGLSDLIAALIREEYERRFPGDLTYPALSPQHSPGGVAAITPRGETLNEPINSSPPSAPKDTTRKVVEVWSGGAAHDTHVPGPDRESTTKHPVKSPVRASTARGKKPPTPLRGLAKKPTSK